MHVIVATQSTGTDHPHLVSIALVAEDGSELYIELGHGAWSLSDCTAEVTTSVLPLLNPDLTTRRDTGLAAHRIREFLSRYSEVTVLSDTPLDLELFGELLTERRYEIPEQVAVALLAWEVPEQAEAFRREAESQFSGGLHRHHALDEAKAKLPGMWAAKAAPEK